ncbi:MAG: DNA polymerase III subunit delta' [candidate division WS6 bacterium OLB20]|uniref:DNA polymerase III subunit delta n=1 Tax=candidate division WS6 bacterium OLB20 TaxID=1617426 RepID=A0A136LY66_9BACT|nr:MAG: DNA polymerase III subunit delta' [candidate division WS6 bacterium OLB20]
MGRSYLIHSNDRAFAQKELERLYTELGVKPGSDNDVLSIHPAADKKSIGVKEIEELIHWSSLKPHTAPQKLGEIHSAELLTTEAQNKLLKTLEEPSEHTSLVLISAHAGSLLETIRSRCITFEYLRAVTSGTEDSFLSRPFSVQLKTIDEIGAIRDRAEQRLALEELLLNLSKEQRRLLHGPDSKKALRNIATIQKTATMLTRNVSLKLALENLIIQLQP